MLNVGQCTLRVVVVVYESWGDTNPQEVEYLPLQKPSLTVSGILIHQLLDIFMPLIQLTAT